MVGRTENALARCVEHVARARRVEPAERVAARQQQRGRIAREAELNALTDRVAAQAESISATIAKQGFDYWTGTVYTTNRRVWEHDDTFKDYLRMTRAIRIGLRA